MVVEVGGVTSTFGPQIVSNRPTNERTKFGSAGRHDGELMGHGSGGPYEFKLLGQTDTMGTEPVSAFGRQSHSRCRTAPSYKIGTNFRHDHSMGPKNAPGPGFYELGSSLGKQPLSVHEKLPAYGMGTGGRFSTFKTVWKPEFNTPAALDWKPASGWLGDAPKYSFHGKAHRADISRGLPGQKPTSLDDPGPGTYQNASSLGKQPESRKETAARTRIGTADRHNVTKTQYLSRDQEFSLYGKHSPAPNLYNPTKCLAQSSRVPRPASFRFGSGDRFSQIKTTDYNRGRNPKLPGPCNPGPGQYVP